MDRCLASLSCLKMHAINPVTTKSSSPLPSFRLKDLDDRHGHHAFAFVVWLTLAVLLRIDVYADSPGVSAQTIGAPYLPEIVRAGK